MNKFTVTELNNFCRVFRLPLKYPEGFCFCGGYVVKMQMVDWFNPVCPKDGYINDYPRILEGDELEVMREGIVSFIQGKVYMKEYFLNDHLVITDYGDTILVKNCGVSPKPDN